MSVVRLVKPVVAVVVGLLAVGALGASPASAAPKKPRLPVALTQQPADPSASDAATFGWTQVPGATYTCSLDGGAATSCSSPKLYSGLLDGTHTFVLRGRLASYRPGTSVVSWTVDTTPPGAPAVTPVPSPTRSTSAVISFTNADPSAYTHTCRLDADAPVACTSPWPVAGPLGDGTHAVVVQSSDVHGVLGGATTVSWEVDITAPANVQLVGPGSPTASSNASFTFSATGATSFLCSLDGAPAATCTSPHVIGGVGDGAHSMTVSASDGAGNVAQPATAVWSVDTTAPAGPDFLSGPATVTNQQTADFVVNSLDGSSLLQCRLDSTSSTDWATCPSPLHYAGITAGVHSLDVRAVDAAGNTSQVSTAHWSVDLTAPAPARFLSGPRSPSNASLPDFDFVSTDGSDFGFRCSLDSSSPADLVDCDIDTVPLGPAVTEGDHVLRVAAVDQFGAVSAPVGWSWTVDLTPPTQPVFVTTPASSTTADDATFEFTSEPGAQFTCSLDSAAAGACTNPITFSGLTEGSHSFLATARDAAGNTSQSAYAWTVTPPVVVPPVVVPPVVVPPVVVPPVVDPPVVDPPVVTDPVSSGSTPPLASTATPAVTVSVSTSRALLGRSTVTFSAAVRNISAASVRLQPATGRAAPVALRCATATGTEVSCSGETTRVVTVTPTRPLVPGQTYTLSLTNVTDTNGRTVTGTQSFRASTDEQETSAAASYRWGTAKAAKALGRSYLVEDRKGATLSYTFTGTEVTWFTMTGPSQGIAQVYVDGVRKALVNNWAPTTNWRVARTVKGLKAGTHRLRLVVTGRKGAASGTGTNIVLDATKVGTKVAKTPVTAATWRHTSATAASARAYSVTRLAGASTTFAFRGTSVTWSTRTGPAMGKAKVYVDGVLRATIDNYAKRGKWNVRRTVAGLADATHIVTVTATGAKRRVSRGTDVVVDRWLVG